MVENIAKGELPLHPNPEQLFTIVRRTIMNDYASSQKITALAAATFSESTPCIIGIRTV